MMWLASFFGIILEGQGINEIVVEWVNFLFNQLQWVVVEFDNCYLGCVVVDIFLVCIIFGFLIEVLLEVCVGDIIVIDVLSIFSGSFVFFIWVF